MLCQQIETLRLKVLAERGIDPRVLPDTGQMRDRLFAAKPPGGAFDVRQGAGRLQDIDLLAQSCALRAGDPARSTLAQLRAGRRAGLLTTEQADRLSSIWRGLWRVHAAARLLTDRALDMDVIGRGGQDFLLREVEADSPDTLRDRLSDDFATVQALVEGHLSDESPPD